MEKSTNYNFNLPNSANDEIADINDISDNFRIIDSIMNETDQTFEPTSSKAASGKAVSEAIRGINPIDENTEFIFNGGNADGAVSVDIVVDSALSKVSNNAIANKPVATKFDEILKAIEQAKKDVLLSAYPVGAIYLSVSETNPSTLFGGIWERIAKGRTLVGVDDTDTDFETVGKTGGEKTHTLSVNEMPEHSHKPQGWAYQFQDGTGERVCLSQSSEIDNWDTPTTSTGGGQAHNNLQPYITCFIWKRTE